MVPSLLMLSPLVPPHLRLTPQPSLWLVIPVEDHPQLTPGQEMVKSSPTVPSSYSISLQVDLGSSNAFRDSLYRSTLIVTGVLPGIYQYSVTNRATSGMVTNQMTIEFEGTTAKTTIPDRYND